MKGRKKKNETMRELITKKERRKKILGQIGELIFTH